MSSYKQLTREQRYQIKSLLDTDVSQSRMAEIIKVSPSTISRELKRNRGKRGYRPKQAHEKTIARRESKSQPRIRAEVWLPCGGKAQERLEPGTNLWLIEM